MLRSHSILLVILSCVSLVGFLFYRWKTTPVMTGAPPYGEALEDVPVLPKDTYGLLNWKRPDGPPRVGLQVGHWKNADLPEELSQLKGSTGASGGGFSEWEVNFAIAEEAAKLLRAQGVTVDILPSTIPPRYWADAFVAIHADGNLNTSVNGYKVSSSWRDFTGNADELVSTLEASYAKETQLALDPNISRNMRGYYAFAWWRYEHAIHPMTTAVIFETGFLSNPSDRKLIAGKPEKAALGLSTGILEYLESQNLLSL